MIIRRTVSALPVSCASKCVWSGAWPWRCFCRRSEP